MLRILTLALLVASATACSRKEPPVRGSETPDDDPSAIVISIVATPARAAIDGSTLVKIAVTVSDRTGLLLPGRRVELSSSVEGDSVAPWSGLTGAAGAFVSDFAGTTPGPRLVTARVDGGAASAEVVLLESPCTGDLLVGGQPPALVSWPRSHRATGFAIGDLNGDGRDDVVVTLASVDSAAASRSQILVRLGDGSGGPASESIIPWEREIRASVLADFDGDGILDLVLVSAQPKGSSGDESRLDLLLGSGDGAFRPGAELGKRQFDLGKLIAVVPHGGAKAQLVVSAAVTSSSIDLGVSVLELRSDGEWRELASQTFFGLPYPFFGLPLGELQAADLNRDGKVDLRLNGSSGVEIWLGTDEGSFEPAAAFHEDAKIAGDLDGDGLLDLVAILPNRTRFKVWRGQADGTFEEMVTGALEHRNYPQFLGAWDFDGDGTRDLFFADLGTLLVFLGDRAGGFGAPIEVGAMPVQIPELELVSIAVADLQGDGRPEIAFLGSNVLAAFTAGSNLSRSRFPKATEFRVDGRVIAVGHFQGDGTDSIVLGTRDLHQLRALGPDRVERSHHLAGEGPIASMAIKPDLDPLCVDDLILLRYEPGRAVLSIASVGGQWEIEVPFSSPQMPKTVASGDFNGDGRSDIALFTGESVVTLLADEQGSFVPGATSQVAGGVSITVSDLDGDGRADIVVTGPETVILLGDGAGGFAPSVRFPIPGQVVAVADLNRDGRQDLILGHADTGVTVILAGDTFSVATYEVGGASASFTLGDFDDDYALDIAAIGPGETIAILRGLGDGRFAPAVTYPAGTASTAVAFGRFHRGSGGLAVLREDGRAQLMPFACASPD